MFYCLGKTAIRHLQDVFWPIMLLEGVKAAFIVMWVTIVMCSLDGCAYLRLGAYWRKYGIIILILQNKVRFLLFTSEIWTWTEIMLLHAFRSCKCKYVMNLEAAIGGCSENEFPEREYYLKVPMNEFFI